MFGAHEKFVSLYSSRRNSCLHRHGRLRRWNQYPDKSDRDGHDAAANGFGADAHSGSCTSSCSCSGAGAGAGTHANAGTNANISDRTMGGRIA